VTEQFSPIAGDHSGKRRILSKRRGRCPVVLVFSRGSFCLRIVAKRKDEVSLTCEMEVAIKGW
jgi:hypothetical protein